MLNNSLIINLDFSLSVIFLLLEKTLSDKRSLITKLSQTSENEKKISIILIASKLYNLCFSDSDCINLLYSHWLISINW